MVEEVKVTRNYQVTIPSSARAKMGVKVGDVLIVGFHDSEIIFRKKTSNISKLHIRLGKKIDWRDVERSVREAGGRITRTSRSREHSGRGR